MVKLLCKVVILVNLTVRPINNYRREKINEMCGYGLHEEGVKFLGVVIDENLRLETRHKEYEEKNRREELPIMEI